MTEEERLDKNNRIREAGKATRLKRKQQVCKTYTVKIQSNSLTKKQEEQLKMLFVEAKWLYNDILNYSKDHDINTYNTKTKTVKIKLLDGSFETRELKYLGSSIKKSVFEQIKWSIKSLAACKSHGRKIGALKFKSDFNTINFLQNNNTHRIIDSKHIKLQRISGYLKVNGLNQFINIPDIEITTAKLIKKPDGYYIAITTFVSIPEESNYIGDEIGIDMGIKTGITFSNGEKFNIIIEETERLKRLQKKLSRKKKGSNNYNKTKLFIEKEHLKITNRKNDAANKVVHHILQFKTVYMQDEMISNWHKGLFGKRVQHSILGRVKAKLINHSRVEVLDRSVPTTQYCPQCGKNTKHTLDKRGYNCEHCGYHDDDRDVHAAKNMIRMVKILKEK